MQQIIFDEHAKNFFKNIISDDKLLSQILQVENCYINIKSSFRLKDAIPPYCNLYKEDSKLDILEFYNNCIDIQNFING
jgi:hypothetical protein